MEREHAWVIKTEDPHPFWEERSCAVCGLKDMRARDRKSPRGDWEVSTPCIEPVPELVSYDKLMTELVEHKVSEQPYVMGHPGDWNVGFCIGRGTVYPHLRVETPLVMEHGFAQLLRWIRARQYNVHRYSDIGYQRQLANHSCGCCDDD